MEMVFVVVLGCWDGGFVCKCAGCEGCAEGFWGMGELCIVDNEKLWQDRIVLSN